MKTQVILAGVGGQGILFSSRVFSELGLKLGLKVMGSETHGMSQRGGSVIAHLKLGDFESPLIRTGSADFLYSLEENETYKTLGYLRNGGACFVNLDDEDRFDKKILNHLSEKKIAFRACDASGLASELGEIRSTNIVLIGFSLGTGLVPFAYEDVRSVLESVSRKGDLRVNLKALESGFKEGLKKKN